MTQYLVVYENDLGEDAWAVHDSLEDAVADYEFLIKDEHTVTASVCAVVKSTDYDTHPLLKGLA